MLGESSDRTLFYYVKGMAGGIGMNPQPCLRKVLVLPPSDYMTYLAEINRQRPSGTLFHHGV